MNLRWRPEKTVKAWCLRMFIGPAMVLDGVFHFLTIGCLSMELTLRVSRALAMVRMETA